MSDGGISACSSLHHAKSGTLRSHFHHQSGYGTNRGSDFVGGGGRMNLPLTGLLSLVKGGGVVTSRSVLIIRRRIQNVFRSAIIDYLTHTLPDIPLARRSLKNHSMKPTWEAPSLPKTITHSGVPGYSDPALYPFRVRKASTQPIGMIIGAFPLQVTEQITKFAL